MTPLLPKPALSTSTNVQLVGGNVTAAHLTYHLMYTNDDIKKAIRLLEDIAVDLEATDVYGRNEAKVLFNASAILDEIRKKA